MRAHVVPTGGACFFLSKVRAYHRATADSAPKLKALQHVKVLTHRFSRRGIFWQFAIW